jgi:hypothetical protein
MRLHVVVVEMCHDRALRHLEIPAGHGWLDLLCRLNLPTREHFRSDRREVLDAPPTCLRCVVGRL